MPEKQTRKKAKDGFKKAETLDEYYRRQELLIEKEEKKQKIKVSQPAHFLVDTMIVHDIINKKYVMEKLENYAVERNPTIFILDRIVDETHNMEIYEYSQEYSNEEILSILKGQCQAELIKVNWNSKRALRAREIYESKRYLNKDGIPLSKTDAVLLVWAQENSWILITRDTTLIRAAKEEGKKANKTIRVFNPFVSAWHD